MQSRESARRMVAGRPNSVRGYRACGVGLLAGAEHEGGEDHEAAAPVDVAGNATMSGSGSRLMRVRDVELLQGMPGVNDVAIPRPGPGNVCG
jgi:hypothetical protein